jgi:hypothetical protein
MSCTQLQHPLTVQQCDSLVAVITAESQQQRITVDRRLFATRYHVCNSDRYQWTHSFDDKSIIDIYQLDGGKLQRSV